MKQWCTSYPTETVITGLNRETKSVSVMPTSKKTSCLATVAACVSLLVVPAIPAKAQVVIDLSVVTCGQYMDKDRDTKDVLAAWMSGYFNAAKNQSMVDLARSELVTLDRILPQ